MDDLTRLGQAVRGVRRRRHLTQSTLARETGVSRSTISLLETGALQDLGIQKVLRVLEYLGLEIAVRPAGELPTLEDLQREREEERG
jgi:transcriptional regulator with XRE-family HTH domain